MGPAEAHQRGSDPERRIAPSARCRWPIRRRRIRPKRRDPRQHHRVVGRGHSRSLAQFPRQAGGVVPALVSVGGQHLGVALVACLPADIGPTFSRQREDAHALGLALHRDQVQLEGREGVADRHRRLLADSRAIQGLRRRHRHPALREQQPRAGTDADDDRRAGAERGERAHQGHDQHQQEAGEQRTQELDRGSPGSLSCSVPLPGLRMELRIEGGADSMSTRRHECTTDRSDVGLTAGSPSWRHCSGCAGDVERDRPRATTADIDKEGTDGGRAPHAHNSQAPPTRDEFRLSPWMPRRDTRRGRVATPHLRHGTGLSHVVLEKNGNSYRSGGDPVAADGGSRVRLHVPPLVADGRVPRRTSRSHSLRRQATGRCIVPERSWRTRFCPPVALGWRHPHASR